MSDKKEPGMAYNMSKLNKVFAIVSVLFLMTVIWVFVDDYFRPWKVVQIESLQIKRKKLIEKAKKAQEKINDAEVAALEKKLAAAKKEVLGKADVIEKINAKLNNIEKDIKSTTIVLGKYNAQVAALTFQYGVAHGEHSPKAEGLLHKLESNKKLYAETSDKMKGLESQKRALKKEIVGIEKDVTTTEKRIASIFNQRNLLNRAIKTTDIQPTTLEGILFAVRNSPMIDYLDPTLKIHQIVLNDITDDRYFQHVPKVDRCTTCHTFIGQKGFEEEKNPFKTHPKLDLILGAKSPHPMKKIGCTVCHGGEGQRVHDFQSVAHIPQNDQQKAVWEKKYHWHAPHKVPQEMHKLQYTEAGCVKCHSETQYIPGATALNEGRRNIQKFGCYACHKIKGWEDLRNPGPSLEKIAAKVDKKFFKKWVWDPKVFNKHAKMPSFFMQENNKDPAFVAKNITEVNAMAEFIWSKSQAYQPIHKYTGGNREKGKELVETIGCMGCHGVEGLDEQSHKVDAFAGPYLTGLGSKISGDWLVTWLRKPQHFQENTIMPSFRLSNREANDIAAFLLASKNKTFEKLEFEKINPKLRDDLLVEYFAAFDTIAVAKKKLATFSEHEKTLELGKRSIGKYGCYSCHTIDGFAGRAPIGPELTNVGSKPLTQFGFGHEKVEHSRSGWIKAHLLNPRRWDNGADKPFKGLLRMPNLNMTEAEADSITLALLGQVSDYIPKTGVKNLNAHEEIAAKGMKTIVNLNCIGCHKIDSIGGDILAMFDDVNEGPPRLIDQGHKQQSTWFYHFLDNVSPIRPWLKVRMPSFNLSVEDKNNLTAFFQAKSKQPTFVEAKVIWEKGERTGAIKLFKSLDCASCHTTGFNTEEATAPDLHNVGKRLRPSWIEKWLRNPQAILEGTIMPSFWEDGESTDTDIFAGNADKQIKALVKYLIEISKNEYEKPLPKN